MALIDMWMQNREGIREKSLHQLLAFASEGKLADGNSCSKEFRGLLNEVPLDVLRRYASDALNKDENSPGLALQDIVNELGIRLGFHVEQGLYRGRQGESGHDGLWVDSVTNHSIIIEVKTTSAYRIKLEPIARYQDILIEAGKIAPRKASALIVVGHKNEDTADLEAQIRGSRNQAGDVRVISLEGLFKMVALKNDTDDPDSARLLRGILVPREYTKLDELLEVVNFVAQDLAPDEPTQEEPEGQPVREEVREGAYISNLDKEKLRHEAVAMFQKRLGQEIKSISKSLYETKDGQTAICYTMSKPYPHSTYTTYWFGFHDYHKDFMEKHSKGIVAYSCTGAGILMIPWEDFSKHVSYMGETTTPNGRHWRQVVIRQLQNDVWKMQLRANAPENPVDVSRWALPIGKDAK